jgi:hypothetical protein
MSARAKPKKERRVFLLKTDTAATVDWLYSLEESAFRDEILAHLYKKMLKVNAISWYDNIHGRNDKGVDFLLRIDAELGSRVVGIQAKSIKITRSGDTSDSSAIRIIAECEAATKHEFDIDTGRSKVDNIELWCSNHITEDAEKEFRAPGVSINIRIRKAEEVAALIEKYCPDLLNKIPELSLSLYIKNKQEPASKALRILGAPVNPKYHFLAPTLSKHPAFSTKFLRSRKNVIRKVDDHLKIDDLLDANNHVVVVGTDLSGKTYLLERIDYLIASRNELTVFFPKGAFGVERIGAIEKHIAKSMAFLSVAEVKDLSASGRISLLVDDFHRLLPEQQAVLLALNPAQYKIIAASNTWSGGQAQPAYIVGIDHESIPTFLRSIDSQLGERSFTDRAHAYINRTIASSGLSLNPFTVAVMLNECQSGSGKFSTPTLGRLIERFIELQLGSHSDYEHQVDFETKREFLIKLAGNRNKKLTVEGVKRALGKFIERKSHPHALDVFFADLVNSGVFEIKEETISWSHPVIAEYFWVRNLVGRQNLAPIVAMLKRQHNVTLAAIVGSQLRNADKLGNTLCDELANVSLPTPETIIDTIIGTTYLKRWAEGEGEEELLSELEKEDTRRVAAKDEAKNDVNARTVASAIARSYVPPVFDSIEPKSTPKMTPENRDKLKGHMEEIFQMLSEGRFYLAANLSALLINARDTDTDLKMKAVTAVLRSTEKLGGVLLKITKMVIPDNKRVAFVADWTRLYFQLFHADRLLGDPFLTNIFRKLLKVARNNSETLALLDLLVACGDDDYLDVAARVRAINRIEITFALYMRMLALYYYRYHKERERRNIREFLRRLRLIHKDVPLPIPA